ADPTNPSRSCGTVRGSSTCDPSRPSGSVMDVADAPVSSKKVALTVAPADPRFCMEIGVFHPFRSRMTMGSTRRVDGSATALFAAACGRPGGGVGTAVGVRTPVGVTVGVGDGAIVGVGTGVGV